MSRKNKLMIAFFTIVAAIIGYGIVFINGMKNMAPWTDSDQAWIIPIGILAGIGLFVSQGLWDEIKEERKKKKE